MTEKYFIYFPCLHPALAPQNLPEQVLFMEPGLKTPQQPDAPRMFTPQGLPFPPKEAAFLLRDLLSLGQDLEGGGELKRMAAEEALRGLDERQGLAGPGLKADEEADLRRFAAGLDLETEKARQKKQTENPEAKLPEARKKAQQSLLLAWELEERLLEIAGLEEKFAESGRLLRLALSDSRPGGQTKGLAGAKQPGAELVNAGLAGAAQPEDAEDAALLAALGNDFLAGYGLPKPEWRSVTAALAAFLPDDCILCSADPDVKNFLRDMAEQNPEGSGLRKVDGNLPGCPFAPEQAELFQGPVWRLLGLPAGPKDKPWLNVERHILLIK